MSRQNPIQLPRGRPRGFDVEAAVERAMGVFWSRGYHGTALPDLLRATKLSRGSLYAAFGDKHSLFLRSLDRYIADAVRRMDIELAPPREPVDGLRAYLAGYVDRTSGANGRRGCLLVATAMELAGQFHGGGHQQAAAPAIGAAVAVDITAKVGPQPVDRISVGWNIVPLVGPGGASVLAFRRF